MKKLVILLFLSTSLSYGQDLRTYALLPDTNMIKTAVGKRITYNFPPYTFEGTGNILKVRENKKMIFADEGEEELKKSIPHIFLSPDTTDHLVLMTDLMAETLYGFNVYLLNGIESVKIGFFPVAALDPVADRNQENIAVVSIADKLLLETDGQVMHITFSAGSVVLRPGTFKEEVVDGNLVKFLYNGKKLKEVEEF